MGSTSVTALTVNGCGLVNSTVTYNATTGAFTITIPTSQAAGACNLVFTGTTASGSQTTTVPFTVTSTGPVTLSQSSAPAGTTVSGTVANASTVQSLTVTGCGYLTAGSLPLSGSNFTVTIPTSEGAGPCTYTFIINYINGQLTTEQVPFTVTVGISITTTGPDLTAASVNTSTNQVTYTFDKAANGISPVTSLFNVYNTFGFVDDSTNLAAAKCAPTAAAVSVSNPDQVIVQFPPAGSAPTAACPVPITSGAWAQITVAGVERAAVASATGAFNPEGSVPLSGITVPGGFTSGPDLVSVGNFQTTALGVMTADYTFDEAVNVSGACSGNLANLNTPVCEPANAAGVAGGAGITPGDFELIMSDNTPYNGSAAAATVPTVVNAAQTIVRVTFVTAGVSIPTSQIVRGVADVGGLTGGGTLPTSEAAVGTSSVGFAPNPITTIPVTNSGQTTDVPELTSAAVTATNQVTYTFDKAVTAINLGASTPAGEINMFMVWGANTTQWWPTAVIRSNSNADQVIATYAPGALTLATLAATDDCVSYPAGGPPVAASVGIFGVNLAPATAKCPPDTTNAGIPSAGAEEASVPLANVTAASGVIQGPQLVSVTKAQDAFGNWSVTFNFTQPIVSATAGSAVANPTTTTPWVLTYNAAFDLYDSNSTQFTANSVLATAVPLISNGGASITFSAAGGAWSNAQIAAAVIGGIEPSGSATPAAADVPGSQVASLLNGMVPAAPPVAVGPYLACEGSSVIVP